MKKTAETELRQADLTEKSINLSFDNSSFSLLIQRCMCMCVKAWSFPARPWGNHSIISLTLRVDPVQTNLSCHINPSYHISAT